MKILIIIIFIIFQTNFSYPEENKTIMNSLIDAVGSGASALGGAVKAVTPTEPIFPTQKGTLRTADPSKPYEALFYPTEKEADLDFRAREADKRLEDLYLQDNPPVETLLPPAMPSTLDEDQKEIASALMSVGTIDQNTMNRSAQIAKKLGTPIHNVLMDVPAYAEMYKEQQRQETVLGNAPLGRFIRNNLHQLPAVKDQLEEVKQAQTWYGRLALGVREPFRELAETNINAERTINGQEPYVRNEDPALTGEKSGFWYGVGYHFRKIMIAFIVIFLCIALSAKAGFFDKIPYVFRKIKNNILILNKILIMYIDNYNVRLYGFFFIVIFSFIFFIVFCFKLATRMVNIIFDVIF